MLTSPEPTDDPLEALLRAAPHAIPDDGFADRVCAALPPRKSRDKGMRRLVLLAALLLGCVLALPAWSRIDLAPLFALVNASRGRTFELWHALVVIIALSAWVVIRDAREGESSAGL